MSSAESLESSSKRSNVESQKKKSRSVCRLSEAETSLREKGNHSNNAFRQIGSNRDSIPRYECSKVSSQLTECLSYPRTSPLRGSHAQCEQATPPPGTDTVVKVLLTVLEPPVHITVIHNILKQVAHRISGPVPTPSFSPRKN